MMDYALLDALATVLRAGSFEKAARLLGLTPSAVSQRIKLLEERLGLVLVVRGQPCTATPAGQKLFRHAEEVALLENSLREEIGIAGIAAERPSIRIAVNADSLATWFVPAMAAVDDCLFDLVLDDQDHSAEWLRRGEVRAAVSGDSGAVQGCDSRSLGSLRYLATASPAFVRRWFPDGVTPVALAAAPCLTFNAKDMLQARWIGKVFGEAVATPTHWLPSSEAFVDATLAGIGWGMNPELLVRDLIAEGKLVPLVADSPYDVPLYWHWSRSVQPAIRGITTAVVQAAGAVLLAPEA